VTEFLHMGGYAVYVWPAYAITAIVLILNWWSARRLEMEQRAAASRRSTRVSEARG